VKTNLANRSSPSGTDRSPARTASSLHERSNMRDSKKK
jgi:hypothetical protein